MENAKPSYTPDSLEQIDFDDRAGLEYWMAELSCTRDALFSALHEVGNYTKDVRSYLVLKSNILPQPKETGVR